MLLRSFTFLLVFISLLLSAQKACAQQGDAEIRGFLYEAASGEPIPFASVFLKGTSYGTSTDVNGYYSLTKLKAGTYQLTIVAVGFDSVSQSTTLKAGEIRNEKFQLKERSIELKTVDIKVKKVDKEVVVNTGLTKISPRDIQIMPSFGGEPDLAQYLQTIPGVVFTGDQGGQLYIRGGTPVQTLFLLDGMTIYNPFHSIGLFSVFDTDIIRNVDIITGGFSAEYGGRTSAVMDVTTRDGNKKRFGGGLSVSPFSAKINLEGPLSKSESVAGGSSFLLSCRNSYLDKTAPILYEYANKGKLPFSFLDTYGKVTFSGSTGSKLNLFGFNFTDKAALNTGAAVNWNSWGTGFNAIILPTKSSFKMEAVGAYSNYKIQINEPYVRERTSSINGFDLGFNFSYFIEKSELRYGVKFMGNTTDFTGYTSTNVKQVEHQNNTELAAYIKYRHVRNRFILEPSLRMHFYASLSAITPEPRLGAKYNISPRLRLKASGGVYTQNLISTRSDRDVVNLFAGYLSSPEILEDAAGKRIDNRIQRARHLITGLEYDITEKLELNIEPYVKYFNQVTNINRERIFITDPTYVVETGLAKGLDVLLRYEADRITVQGGYSLAKVDRTYGKLTYPTNFDRRHNVNLLALYSFGENQSWEVSGRWNLGSGFPFTPTLGFYEYFNPTSQGGIDFDPITANGELGVLYAKLNSGRLPYYHRLDLSVQKTWKFSASSSLEATAAVTNAYDRKNIFYFDRVTSTRVDQLPILPSIGLTYRF